MDIVDALGRAENLRVFPRSALKIRSVVTSTDSSFRDLEQAVSMDPALSAQVLKVANSPYFGVSRKIVNLRQALVLLGYEATRDLALALALLSLTSQKAGSTDGLWAHSLSTGLAARLLAEAVQPDAAGEAFVAGLLHDLGKLVAHLVYEGDRRYPWTERSTEASLALEISTCGFDHAELGAACLEQWNLANATCEAIRYHHRPQATDPAAEAGVLSRILALADDLVHVPDQTADQWCARLDELDLSPRLSPEKLRDVARQAPLAAEQLGLA